MQLALYSAVLTGLCWGVATFAGGRAARQVSPPLLTAIYNVVAGIIFGILYLYSSEREAISQSVNKSYELLTKTFLWGTLGGLSFAIGLTTITYGLSKGRSAVVGPIASTIEVLLPFIYAIVVSQLPNNIAIAGIVLLIFVPWLVTKTTKQDVVHETSVTKDISIGVLSGIGFGSYYLALIVGPEKTPLLTMTIVQVSSAIAMIGVHVYLKNSWKIPSKFAVHALTFVIFETLGALFLRYAVTRGSPAVVSTLSAIVYVTSLLLLSYLIIKERFSRSQLLGFALTIIGVALAILNT